MKQNTEEYLIVIVILVSDPTDLNARSNLPGARVHGEKETITGNKVEDFIIYMIYPF